MLGWRSNGKDFGWSWGFINEVRFALWCSSLDQSDVTKPAENILPPLDVIMVWHSYLLNPGWYAEDCDRIPSLTFLKDVGRSFASSLSRLPEILGANPSPARMRSWTSKTKSSFDPLEDARQRMMKIILCPKCRVPIDASFVNNEGAGYFQDRFSVRCTSAGCNSPPITKDVLAVRKLAEDLVRNDMTACSHLAGTLRTPKAELDIDRAKSIKETFMKASEFRKPSREECTDEEWVVSIMEKCSYNYESMKQIMENELKSAGEEGSPSMKRICSAYEDDRVFSIELVGAVIRQGSFVEKMRKLGWTEPHFFDNSGDEVALLHAIGRYHAFLDLLASSRSTFFVPTLDIDLAWHTHQLMAQKYNDQCRTYVRRFIDHDDNVGEGELSKSFDITCRAWKVRYGVQYTHCGCPLPVETVGERLSHLDGALPLPYLQPQEDDDVLVATHPSKHDIITLGAHVAKANRMRAARKRSLAHPQLSKHSKQIAERGRKEAEKRALAARQVLLQAEIRRRAEGAKSRPVGKFPKEDRGSEIGSALENIMSQLISFTNSNSSNWSASASCGGGSGGAGC